MEVIEIIKKGEMLDAIRKHRFLHGSGFEESKVAVEDLRPGSNIEPGELWNYSRIKKSTLRSKKHANRITGISGN
ncbi:MAG: hypothetical protein IPJ46_08905 [Anaerolineales bacterium]|nr:hypothetical protein [Anaerolineales bacterium]